MDLVEATHVFSGEGTRHPWETAPLDVARKLLIDARIGLALRRIGIPVPGLSNFAVCRKSA
jgi:hypothetical protein